jgi:uncharacterized MAPEG superfamily protein
MKLAVICLLITAILPILLTWAAAYFRNKDLGFIDNQNPRKQYLLLDGIGGRTVAAQKNTWEALVVYSAALIAVFITNVPAEAIANACLIFMTSRLLFIGLYLINLDKLRSLAFISGYGSCLYMFYLAIMVS